MLKVLVALRSLRREGRVDACHEGRFEWTSLSRRDALQNLRPVLAAEHDAVDGLHRKRIAMSKCGRRCTKLPGQRAECLTALEVSDDGVLRWQVPVERVG